MKTCPKCGTEYPDTTTLCPADGVALEKTGDDLIGKTLAGKYRIEERLSVGGMGSVYRGTHIMMDKTVAIKVLRPSLAADEKIVARFSREARAASRISHPHALSVTDFGESEDGVVFLVMEYLSGKTLKEIIREGGPMPLGRVIEIMRQVGDALTAAHAQGVIHRDLKSDNIMLLSTGGADYTKVLDFGIAKIQELEGGYDPSLTAPDLVIGTPQYMSPEQCSQSSDIDARSDIYSLGVIIYEMLVGHVPFSAETPTATMLKHLQEPAPSVLDERPDLPHAVAHVVSRSMAKLPQNRYQSVAALVEDLTVAGGSDLPVAAEDQIRLHTQATSAVQTMADDWDEETLVRPRVDQSTVTRPPDLGPALPSTNAFNPWKIVVPSIAGLLVIFAVVYAFTRGSEPTNPNAIGPTLVTDPNSQAVDPSQPPTGKSEVGIPVGGTTTSQGATVNTNAKGGASPAPTGVVNENDNTETNPNPSNTNNANARPAPSVPLPSPSRPLNTNEEPPPPAKPSTPKPTLPPPTVTPPSL